MSGSRVETVVQKGTTSLIRNTTEGFRYSRGEAGGVWFEKCVFLKVN